MAARQLCSDVLVVEGREVGCGVRWAIINLRWPTHPRRNLSDQVEPVHVVLDELVCIRVVDPPEQMSYKGGRVWEFSCRLLSRRPKGPPTMCELVLQLLAQVLDLVDDCLADGHDVVLVLSQGCGYEL